MPFLMICFFPEIDIFYFSLKNTFGVCVCVCVCADHADVSDILKSRLSALKKVRAAWSPSEPKVCLSHSGAVLTLLSSAVLAGASREHRQPSSAGGPAECPQPQEVREGGREVAVCDSTSPHSQNAVELRYGAGCTTRARPPPQEQIPIVSCLPLTPSPLTAPPSQLRPV